MRGLERLGNLCGGIAGHVPDRALASGPNLLSAYVPIHLTYAPQQRLVSRDHIRHNVGTWHTKVRGKEEKRQ